MTFASEMLEMQKKCVNVYKCSETVRSSKTNNTGVYECSKPVRSSTTTIRKEIKIVSTFAVSIFEIIMTNILNILKIYQLSCNDFCSPNPLNQNMKQKI